MKQALVLLVFVAVAVWVASWFWAGDQVDAAAGQPWPHGLGTLASVPDRYPPQEENDAARNLVTLAAPVSENDPITTYVRKEIASGQMTIAEPPPIPDLSAIRALLLREPIVWKRQISVQHGGLLGRVQMFVSLTRTLIANALSRARRNDSGAWDDLHAAWNLTKSLDGHPHIVLRVVAMSMTRAINAVAWKMPLPAPPWLAEVQERDLVRALFETLQFENWRQWKHQTFALKPFAERIERERLLTAELGRITDCEFTRVTETGNRGDPLSRLDIGWRRAFRYPAEREATANALRARAGQPIEAASQCSDGTWSFDGKTLRFARPIALPEKIDTSMPLMLQVGPAAPVQ